MKKQLNDKISLEEVLPCFRFVNGQNVIPHRKKREKGGEDSHYAIDRLLVVADGVGGWKNHQVDPAEFSKELCQNVSENFHLYELYLKIKDKHTKKNVCLSLCDTNYENEYQEGIYSANVAKKLLIKSSNTAKNPGTSTCTILLLDKNMAKLYTSYVGDSLYMIVRYNEAKKKYYCEYKSDEQMHYESCFNTPYQVGKEGDNPEVALTNSHDLKNNDLVITATDGLWDNLEIERIIDLINENSKNFPHVNPQELANIIAEEAERKSNDKIYFSPFAKKAKDNNLYYLGGKPDDITVIVSLLTNKEMMNCEWSENTSTTDNNEKNIDEILF